MQSSPNTKSGLLSLFWRDWFWEETASVIQFVGSERVNLFFLSSFFSASFSSNKLLSITEATKLNMSDTDIAPVCRKGTATTWTCSWWPSLSLSAPSWACRGTWPLPSPLWPTSWVSKRSRSAPPLARGLFSLESGRWRFGTLPQNACERFCLGSLRHSCLHFHVGISPDVTLCGWLRAQSIN